MLGAIRTVPALVARSVLPEVEIIAAKPLVIMHFRRSSCGKLHDHERDGGQPTLWSRYRTIAANSPGSMLAPPTRAPSTSGCAMMPATLAAFTEPP